MNIYDIIPDKNEKPLDRLVEGYSHTSIFRTIAFVGDSLSSGEFETRRADGSAGFYDFYEYSWGQFIARHNGSKAYNFSIGGMTAEGYDSYADWRSFWRRDLACQAYVIALGYNDMGDSPDIGSAEDVDVKNYKNNKKSFMGNYAAIVSKYKEISPDAKFFFVTFANESEDGIPSKTAQKMADALYTLADMFDNCYVIDLLKYGPVYNEEFKRRYYNHFHMTPAGYLLTARLVDSYIDYIIRHNPDDFKNAGFIGTGIEY